MYTPTSTILMIGGEYRFASPNFFGANLAASGLFLLIFNIFHFEILSHVCAYNSLK